MLAFMWGFMKLWKTHASAKITYREWWLAKNSKWVNSVGWQPRKTTKSWDASKGMGPACWRRWLCPFTVLWWDPVLVPLTKEGHGTAGESPEERHEIGKRAGALPCKDRLGKLGSVWRELSRSPRGILSRTRVKGWGIMGKHWKRGNLC